MKFSKLSLQGWRQFESIEIDFHPRLTVITGANGAGKSTLLRLLSQHYGWSYPVLATPTYSKDGLLSYVSGLFVWLRKEAIPTATTVGKLAYSSGKVSNLTIPEVRSITYNVN